MRNLDGGDEKIEHEATRLAVQRAARKVHLLALLTAVILTALSFAILR
jgi:hypothetical protein